MIRKGDQFTQQIEAHDSKSIDLVIEWLKNDQIREVRVEDFSGRMYYAQAAIDSLKILREPLGSPTIAGHNPPVRTFYILKFTIVEVAYE